MSTIKVNTVTKRTGSTLTLGESGTTVTLACGATQSGFGRTGTVDWCTTAKTSPFTAVSGDGFFVNTTSGTITVTLPASPSAGDIVSFKDYAKTWQTNAVIVCRNGSKIAGSCLNTVLSNEAQSVTLIYVDGTQGWIDIQDSTANITGSPNYIAATGGTVLTCGDFKTHVFTGDGTFCVSNSGTPVGSNKVDYIVVAGGGGAAGFYFSGAGGAGGFRMSNSYSIPAPTTTPVASPSGLSVSKGAIPITVGGGGAGGPTGPAPGPTLIGTSGSSTIFSTITSAGGGGGGHETGAAVSGGSGGGSAGYSVPGNGCGAGGSGNTPPVNPPQGNDGGSSTGSPVPTNNAYGSGGGGGGACASGGGSRPGPGSGGDGGFVGDPFFGPTAPSYGTPGPVASTRYFAGGGGGGGGPAVPNCGQASAAKMQGGAGGGGAGKGPATPGTSSNSGTTNTGGGGGGTGNNSPLSSGRAGGTGGSGVVMIRYKFQN